MREVLFNVIGLLLLLSYVFFLDFDLNLARENFKRFVHPIEMGYFQLYYHKIVVFIFLDLIS